MSPIVRLVLALMLPLSTTTALPQEGRASLPPVDEAKPTALLGLVVRACDGKPLVGAVVRCQRARGFVGCATGWTAEVPSSIETMLTDERGGFSFEFPGPLDLFSIVIMPTDETGTAPAIFLDEHHDPIFWLRGGQTAATLVTAPPSCELSGGVHDEAGQPLGGAEVLVWHAGKPLDLSRSTIPPDARVTTAADGSSHVAGCGQWTLLETAAEGRTGSDRLEIRTEPGARLTGLQLGSDVSSWLEGRVTDLAGVPVPQASVVVSRGGPHEDAQATDVPGVWRRTDFAHYAPTDADGRFRLGPLPRGPVDVGIGKAGFLPSSRRVEPNGSPLALSLDPGASLVGVIRDADGQPVAGATVQTESYGQAPVVSGPDGHYCVPAVPPSAAAVVVVRAAGHALRVVDGVEIAAGHPTTLDLQLERGAHLQGCILRADGTPLSGSVIIRGDRELASMEEPGLLWTNHGFTHLTWEELAGTSSLYADAAGRFDFADLYAGVYFVRVGDMGDHPQLFRVATGPPVTLQLTPKDQQRRRLVGTVLDETTHAPITDYEVNAQYNTIGPQAPDPLGKDGARFVLDLFTGTTGVIVSAPGHAAWHGRFDGEDIRDFEQDILLPAARSLAIRIVDASGRPPSDVIVTISSRGDTVRFRVGRETAYGFKRLRGSDRFVAEGLPAHEIEIWVDRFGAPPGEQVGPRKVDLSEPDAPEQVEIVLPDSR